MRILKALTGATLLMLAPGANASTAESGYISRIYAMTGGAVLFHHSGLRSSRPSCQGADLPTRWTFDSSTPSGQAKLTLLLTAYASHKPISIVGTGNCNAWPDTETVDYFWTTD